MFSARWPIFEDYRIMAGLLSPAPKARPSDFYLPTERAELPSALAKLQRGDRAGVVEFASRYGLLGRSELTGLPTRRHRYGDPLEWIWSHGETLGICLALKEMLDGRAAGRLENYLGTLTPSGAPHGDLPMPRLRFAARDKIVCTVFCARDIRPRANALETLASDVLTRILNENIRHLYPVLTWNPERRRAQQQFGFTALVEVAYWHIAQALQGGRVIRCARPGCGGLFIQTDRRQRFCPTGTKQESPCAVLERVQRYRGKLAEKGGRTHGTKRRQRSRHR